MIKEEFLKKYGYWIPPESLETAKCREFDCNNELNGLNVSACRLRLCDKCYSDVNIRGCAECTTMGCYEECEYFPKDEKIVKTQRKVNFLDIELPG
jgi:hypothetical protein